MPRGPSDNSPRRPPPEHTNPELHPGHFTFSDETETVFEEPAPVQPPPQATPSAITDTRNHGERAASIARRNAAASGDAVHTNGVKNSAPATNDETGPDLAGRDLRDSDLRGHNLRRANLAGASLQRADLTDADLRDADLRGANLTDARGLTAYQLSGTVLRGARLPADLVDFDAVRTLDMQSRIAGHIFVTLLVASFLMLLLLLQTSDVQLLSSAGMVQLPLFFGDIATRVFYRVAPFLLVFLYAGFQLYLLRLWECVAQLPAVFPDGRRFDERCGSWLLLGFASSGFWQLRHQRPPLARLQDAAYAFLAWGLVPLLLLIVWARLLVCRSWTTSGLSIVALGCAITLGCTVHAGCRMMLREGRFRRSALGFHQRYTPALVLCALLLLGTRWAFDGHRAGSLDPNAPKIHAASPRVWFPRLLGVLGMTPFANLHNLNVTARPVSWSGTEDDFALLHGLRLGRADLRYADAWKAFLANADLEYASLQHANLGRCDLRHARLYRASLRGANMRVADARRADFTEANLQYANLSGARLQQARFQYARMRNARLATEDSSNTDLSGALMQHADLRGADLRDANLRGANLQYAQLAGAHLQRANLNGADLRNVKLQEANITNATYSATTQFPRGFDLQKSGAILLK